MLASSQMQTCSIELDSTIHITELDQLDEFGVLSSDSRTSYLFMPIAINRLINL